jgi:hypothetical protein
MIVFPDARRIFAVEKNIGLILVQSNMEPASKVAFTKMSNESCEVDEARIQSVELERFSHELKLNQERGSFKKKKRSLVFGLWPSNVVDRCCNAMCVAQSNRSTDCKSEGQSPKTKDQSSSSKLRSALLKVFFFPFSRLPCQTPQAFLRPAGANNK